MKNIACSVTGLNLLVLSFRTASVRAQLEFSLFDLGADPLEGRNVYDDPAYSDLQASLESRLDYMTNNVSVVQSIESTEDFATFNAAGGLVPWLDNDPQPDKPVSPAVDSKPNAPNLVVRAWE